MIDQTLKPFLDELHAAARQARGVVSDIGATVSAIKRAAYAAHVARTELEARVVDPKDKAEFKRAIQDLRVEYERVQEILFQARPDLRSPPTEPGDG